MIFTRAGLEIGVAATKTHTAQIMALALLALKLGRLKWALTPAGAVGPRRRAATGSRRSSSGTSSRRHPARCTRSRAGTVDRPFFLYLGRHVGVPVCFEGALKLKEISYIPTEAYPAGEMKHGPIALLDEGSPVVVRRDRRPRVRQGRLEHPGGQARGARVIAVATEGNERHRRPRGRRAVGAPVRPPLLSPITANVPLQLFAYAIAQAKGLNVDQPRNLAKTVTVE